MRNPASTHNLTAEWQTVDAKHHLQPFTDYSALHRKGAMIITRAEGVYIYDSDGNQILDGMAGLWCVNIGYGRAELGDIARKQILELPYYNTFFQSSHPPVLHLAQLLSEVSPLGFDKVFFTNSGSEANDTVIRAVRRYWDVMGCPTKSVIISRRNAYHGSTMGGASLGGMDGMHKQGGLPIPNIVHIGQPHWFLEGGDLSFEDFGLKVAQELETKIDELGEDRVAAFIGEPIQGAGGVVVPPDNYWPEIQRICRERNILLVADEVITGFGRTGRWFGSEYFGFEPDLMSIAKGLSSGYLPIGGVMFSNQVAEMLITKGGEFQHGYTYSGHPVSCAVAAENIRLLREERVIENVESKVGPYFQQQLGLLGGHPIVGEIRGVGLIAGIQLAADGPSKRRFQDPGSVGALCRQHAIKNGLIMRAVEDSMVLSPPLIITTTQIDELVDKVKNSLDATARDIGYL